ncbi:LysM peptidoglycan-binding domain-containing protein [Arthrobacter rhombi]|uniref:LysM peptidoglycan-binding domain-containing protein n=1 Tax=Arthrobacter rhombi TaxID=71253 RepID=UPI003F93F137
MAQIALATPVFLNDDSVQTISSNPSKARSGRLTLTRRGRFILIGLPVMLVATTLLVLAGIFTAPVMASDASDTTSVEAQTVSVMEGDTVWALAAEFAPQRDRRDVVAEITEMNDLKGSVLVPGQQIFVPSGS